MNNPIWLNDQQVSDLLDHTSAYQAVRNALDCHAKGDYVQPLKPYVRPQGREQEYEGGRFIAMPAFLGGPFQMAGLKFIAGFPANVSKGIPRASGTLQLNSTETGRTLAIMDCATLSARRTAAVAMVAIQELTPEHPLTVTVVGAGPIGKTVLEALYEIHGNRVEKIRLCDRDVKRARRIRQELAGSDLPNIECFSEAQEATKGADVVITATTGAKSYLEASWLDGGWLLVALSLDDATEQLFLSSDKVIVDDFAQSCREEKLLHRLVKAGEFSESDIAGELGQIISGTLPGRTTENERIYVNPMGMAIEDIAVGVAVLKNAVEAGIGQPLD